MLFPDFLNLIEIQVELGSIQGFIYMCNDLVFFLPSAFMFFSVSVITVHMLSCKNQMRNIPSIIEKFPNERPSRGKKEYYSLIINQ